MKTLCLLSLLVSLGSPLSAALNLEAFNPQFDGVYSIQIQCPPNTESKSCDDWKGDYYLVVTNTLNALRIELFDSASCENRPLYQFIASEIARLTNDTDVKATSITVSRLAELELNFEKLKFGEPVVNGWLRNPALSFDLRVTGDQLVGGSPFYQGEGFDGSLNDLAGTYSGTVGKRSARLHLRRSAMGPGFLATYTTLDDGLALDFMDVSFDSKFGTLALLGLAEPKEYNLNQYFKWTLRAKSDENGRLRLDGIALFNYCVGKSTLHFVKEAN